MKNIFPLIIGLILSTPSARAAPRRVVSLLPSHSEILVVLGATETLAGVTDAEGKDEFPDVPRVGGLLPNLEVLASLKPDLILADVSHKGYEATFKDLGLNAVYLPSTRAQSFDDVFELIRDAARLMDKSVEGEKFISLARKRIQKLESLVPRSVGPKIYFEIWPRPAQACGPRSLQGFLIRRAGASNILPDSENQMPLISREWVARENPDVILHTRVASDEEVLGRPGWRSLSAVKNRRVYGVDQNLFSRAGPKIVDAYESLLEILYGGNE